MNRPKFPQFVTFSECKRICKMARTNISLRLGQAICNKYDIPLDLNDVIYNDRDEERVIQRVYNYFIRTDYQNT